MELIKVLLAEDHTIVRKGIYSLLTEAANIEVVGEAEDGRQAVDMVDLLRPDVILMDINMPNLSGLEATRAIKKLRPAVNVLILTMYTNEEYIYQVLQSGASGYLVKQSAPGELLTAIEAVHRGDTYLSPAISKKIVDGYLRQDNSATVKSRYSTLTPREREILQLITEGCSNKDIAEKLSISVKTVGVHRTNLMEKLDIHNTIDLVKYALRKGIISLD